MIKKILIIISIFLIGASGGVYFYFQQELSRPIAPNKNEVIFEVKSGLGLWKIARDLKEQKVIFSPLAMVVFAAYSGESKKMQSGIYKIDGRATIPQVVNKIAEGIVWKHKVTIPEGWSWWQISDILISKNIIENAAQFQKEARQNEGELFPDTYDFLPGESVDSIIKKMKDNFTKKTTGKQVTREVVILASIVEREAKRDEDRPKIAGVYLNRMKKGMKLEADPTVQYAKGSWEPITKDDYQNVNSPYNTYRVSGWPPGPICNPGIKSLEAALLPAASDYFYFFHLKDGTTIYSKNEDEHNQNKAKYSQEISRAR